MKTWQTVAFAIVAPAAASCSGLVALAAWLYRRRQRRAFWSGPNYIEQIALLAPERPLELPAVRDIRSTVRRARPFWRARHRA